MTVLNRLFRFDMVFGLCCLLAYSVFPGVPAIADAQEARVKTQEVDPYEGKNCVVILYTGRTKIGVGPNGEPIYDYWCPPCEAFSGTWETLSGELGECPVTAVVEKSVPRGGPFPPGVNSVPQIHVFTRKCDGSGWTKKVINAGQFLGPPPTFQPFNLDPIRDAVNECKHACDGDDPEPEPDPNGQCETETTSGFIGGPTPQCQRVS